MVLFTIAFRPVAVRFHDETQRVTPHYAPRDSYSACHDRHAETLAPASPRPPPDARYLPSVRWQDEAFHLRSCSFFARAHDAVSAADSRRSVTAKFFSV